MYLNGNMTTTGAINALCTPTSSIQPQGSSLSGAPAEALQRAALQPVHELDQRRGAAPSRRSSWSNPAPHQDAHRSAHPRRAGVGLRGECCKEFNLQMKDAKQRRKTSIAIVTPEMRQKEVADIACTISKATTSTT